MTTSITIIYDTANNTHLTLTSEVDEAGGVVITHHHLGDNRETLEQMWESAVLLVGICNVAAFQATMWKPSLLQILKVEDILEARKARRRDTLIPTGEGV